MRTHVIIIILIFAFAVSTVSLVRAQEPDRKSSNQTKKEQTPPSKHQFLIEVDPLPYLLGGMGGHFGWTPKNNKHLAYGVGLVVGPEFPDAMHNMNANNRDQGWNLKVNQGAGLWAHYYFKRTNKGWFTGLQVFTQEMELSNDNFPGQSDRTNVLMLAIPTGYVWYPIEHFNLYLRPWAGFGFQKVIKSTFEPGKVTPEMNVGNKEYHLPPFVPFATFHIGYSFE